MKKPLAVLISVFIYIFVFWIIGFLSFALNLALLGKETGNILAFGAIFAFWGSYKVVKWLWNKFLFKKEFNGSNLIKNHSQEELNPPPLPTDNLDSSKLLNIKGSIKTHNGKFIFLGLASVLLATALMFFLQHNPSTPNAVNELEIVNQNSTNSGESKVIEKSYSTPHENSWINSKHGISIRVPDGYFIDDQKDEGIIFDLYSPTEKGRILIEVEKKEGNLVGHFKSISHIFPYGEIPKSFEKSFITREIVLDSSFIDEEWIPSIDYQYSGIKDKDSKIYLARVTQLLIKNNLYTITRLSLKEDFDDLSGRFSGFVGDYYIKFEN